MEARVMEREYKREQEAGVGTQNWFPTVPQMESSARGHCLLGAARMLTLFSAMTVSFRETCTRLSGAKVPQSQPALSFCVLLSFQTQAFLGFQCVSVCVRSLKTTHFLVFMYRRYLTESQCHHRTDSGNAG